MFDGYENWLYFSRELKQNKMKENLMFAHLGNGMTVCDRNREAHGDYLQVAHIGNDRVVEFYKNDLSYKAETAIRRFACEEDCAISEIQNQPVFFNAAKPYVKDFKKDYTLSEYWGSVYMAYSNLSFSPEKRADSVVKDYSEELDEDLIELGDKSGNYQAKYIERFSVWIAAKSRCMSSMITGPANFPVRRAEKSNNAEHNSYGKFRHWREKYFTAVNRVKTPSPEDDLETVARQLDNAIILNENIKEWNKVIRAYKAGKMTIDAMLFELREQGATDRHIKAVTENVDSKYGGHGFGTMGATIKKLRERAEALQTRIQRKEMWEDLEFDGGRITIEDDRVKLFHDAKPEQEIIDQLKRSGFRWSRHWSCWTRKHTGNAVEAAKRICLPK